MPSTLRHVAITGWHFVSTGWAIAGVCVLILVLVESCVRAKDALSLRVGGSRGGATAPASPQAAADWAREFTREFDATRPQRWRSYVYWGRLPSYHGTYINIDSLGRRVTPQPATPATPVARVFFFGGSTMWGNDLRDDHTIAAEAARRLQTIAPARARIEVTNFAENGYVFTQDLLRLILQLRAGNRPDVVVFYGGVNDVGTTVQYGSPGIPQNESKRVAEFALGRAIDRTGFARGLRKDVHALRVLTVEALNQLALVNWVKSLKPPPPQEFISADSAARSTVRVYAENARIIEALAREYGFVPVYVWQAALHSTPKPQSPYEQRITTAVLADPYWHRLHDVHLAIPALIDSAMARVAPGRFIDETALFAGDTTTVFLDRIGHNTEASVPAIVDGFWPALRAAVARGRPGATASATTAARPRGR